MTLGFFFGGGVSAEPAGEDFYECSPAMRVWVDQAAEWTGVSVKDMLTLTDAEDPHFLHIARLRQVVVAIGVVDALAEAGIRPASIGGGSTGGMVAACVAGAVSREDVIGLLTRMADEPEPPDGRAQSIAAAVLPPDADLDWYFGDQRPDVYLAIDGGQFAGSGLHLYMLSGYTAALAELAEQAPPGTITPVTVIKAVHSPLQRYVADFLEPHVRTMTFQPPRIPVFSSLEPKIMHTASDIEDWFVRNPTMTVRMQYVLEGMVDHGVELGVVPGPSVPANVFAYPLPVVHVQTPEDIPRVTAALYELDVAVPAEIEIGGEVAR